MNKLHNFYFLSVLFYWVVCRANVWLLTLILCTTWSSRVHWPPSCHGNSIVGRTDVCDVTIRMTSDLEHHIWDFFFFFQIHQNEIVGNKCRSQVETVECNTAASGAKAKPHSKHSWLCLYFCRYKGLLQLRILEVRKYVHLNKRSGRKSQKPDKSCSFFFFLKCALKTSAYSQLVCTMQYFRENAWDTE